MCITGIGSYVHLLGIGSYVLGIGSCVLGIGSCVLGHVYQVLGNAAIMNWVTCAIGISYQVSIAICHWSLTCCGHGEASASILYPSRGHHRSIVLLSKR